MQPPTSSDGDGGEVSGGGLSRLRSAPPAWLETLLEGDEEDPLKSNHNLTQLLVAASASSSSIASESLEQGRFQRQNSSPADFLGLGSDGYLPSFEISSIYKLESSSSEVPLPLKGRRSAQLPGMESSLIDMEMDRFVEDSIPCRVRAKRGCATHPRSIAERVRRTRISDRIRKLQEIVPNMDKQTTTADMLDEAVEYVKHLQKQIQELSEHRSKCTCVPKE